MEKDDLVELNDSDLVQETQENQIDEAQIDPIIREFEKISFYFENGKSEVDGRICAKSYYTLNQKERMLLIYVDRFRRWFHDQYPKRRPLVLTVANECGIHKFVSTTIRSTVFLFADLIDCWQGPAQFVADFITYDQLEEPTKIVSKLKTISKANENTAMFVFSLGNVYLDFSFI